MSNIKSKRRQEIIQESLRLFASNGFHRTTIPDIAKSLNMSVGNLYNYFKSKDILAQEILRYISSYLGTKLKEINETPLSSKEKIKQIVTIYFQTAQNEPEMIDFFLRVYLANRDVFDNGCEGMLCVNEFVTEIMIFFEEGVSNKELKNQDFFSAFGLFMGYLGGMVFLNGEELLTKGLDEYIDDISQNIYNALKA